MNQNINSAAKKRYCAAASGQVEKRRTVFAEGAHRPRVPPDGRKVRALAPDGEYAGVGEREELDKTAQFERVGFVRIDGVGEGGVVVYFTHK